MTADPSPEAGARRSHRLGLAMLIAVVLVWGLVWPVNKAILASLTPVWMVALRSAISVAALVPLLAVLGRLRLPKRGDMPIILSIGLLHMAGFATISAVGLQVVPAGRSVVLAYTVSLWVVPMAMVVLGERLTARRALGVGLGVAGLVVLFNPLSFDWSDRDVVVGNLLVLGAALLWAANLVHIRRHRWISTPLDLVLWESLVATLVLLAAAPLFEGWPTATWDARLVALMLYGGVIGAAFAYWAMAVATRNLPAMTSGLGLLGVPVVGVVVATLALDEPLTLPLVAGVVLIVGGVAVGATGRAALARSGSGTISQNSDRPSAGSTLPDAMPSLTRPGDIR
jgi:drug/metabolite transporter (DMT)-like permease